MKTEVKISIMSGKEYGNGASFRTLRSTMVENTLALPQVQIAPFLKNKANFERAKMNTSIYTKKDCEEKRRGAFNKNKANLKTEDSCHFEFLLNDSKDTITICSNGKRRKY